MGCSGKWKHLPEANDLDIDDSSLMSTTGKDQMITIDQLKRVIETIDQTNKRYEETKNELFKKKP